jgi:hypothetical protein
MLKMAEKGTRNKPSVIKEEDVPFPLTERDKIGLNQKDEDFELHTWDALKEAIGKTIPYLPHLN